MFIKSIAQLENYTLIDSRKGLQDIRTGALKVQNGKMYFKNVMRAPGRVGAPAIAPPLRV